MYGLSEYTPQKIAFKLGNICRSFSGKSSGNILLLSILSILSIQSIIPTDERLIVMKI